MGTTAGVLEDSTSDEDIFAGGNCYDAGQYGVR